MSAAEKGMLVGVVCFILIMLIYWAADNRRGE